MDVADVIVACQGRQDVGGCPRPHPAVHERLCGRAAAKGGHQNGNHRPARPPALQRCASPRYHNFRVFRVQISARPGLFYAVLCGGDCRGSTWQPQYCLSSHPEQKTPLNSTRISCQSALMQWMSHIERRRGDRVPSHPPQLQGNVVHALKKPLNTRFSRVPHNAVIKAAQASVTGGVLGLPTLQCVGYSN